jgi:hypothetical protein
MECFRKKEKHLILFGVYNRIAVYNCIDGILPLQQDAVLDIDAANTGLPK